MLSPFSCIQLCVTLWAVACQTPLYMGFSRQEYWIGLPFPPPGDLPDPGIGPTVFSACSAAPVDSLLPSHPESLYVYIYIYGD